MFLTLLKITMAFLSKMSSCTIQLVLKFRLMIFFVIKLDSLMNMNIEKNALKNLYFFLPLIFAKTIFLLRPTSKLNKSLDLMWTHDMGIGLSEILTQLEILFNIRKDYN